MVCHPSRSLGWVAFLMTGLAACGPDLRNLNAGLDGGRPTGRQDAVGPAPSAEAGANSAVPEIVDAALPTREDAALVPDSAVASDAPIVPDAAIAPDAPVVADAPLADDAPIVPDAGNVPDAPPMTADAAPDAGGGTCPVCPDPLTSCGPTFTCACGKPTALYSPTGVLEDKTVFSPDRAWYATGAAVFAAASAQPVWPLTLIKAFDWHPTVSGRFAQMEHFSPPRPAAVITVYQLAPDGRTVDIVGRASSDVFHHALAWTDEERIALGAVAGCTTTKVVAPAPMP
jgi:hypothetical protein